MPADSLHQIGQTVGTRLRAARVAKKYTQNQLARPDFSVSYISAIERGQIQPSLRALEILAQRLELSTTDLLPAHPPLVGALVGERGVVGSEEREMLLLEAQIAIRQKNPAQALEVLQKLLSAKSERQQEKTSTLSYVLGWAYLEAGRLQEGEQLLAAAARLAREAADPLYPCILSLQSAIYTAMRNTEQATQLRRESLRALARQEEVPRNMFFLAQLHSSLAQYHSYLGELEPAIEQFRQTLHLLQDWSSCQHLQESYSQLSRAYHEKEFASLANLYSHKWLQANFRCQLAGMRSEIVYALGRVLLQSDPAEAHNYLIGVSQEAEARQDRLSLAGANVQLASWSIAHGELSQAEQFVGRAQEQAEAFGETLIGADAQLLAGELAYRRQDYIVGDRFFEAGLAMLERAGAREDLVEHLAHYAQLLEERNCIQKALSYWKRAYEGRQKNRVLIL